MLSEGVEKEHFLKFENDTRHESVVWTSRLV